MIAINTKALFVKNTRLEVDYTVEPLINRVLIHLITIPPQNVLDFNNTISITHADIHEKLLLALEEK